MVIAILISVVVVAIILVGLWLVPVRRAEAVGSRFYWSRTVQLCARRWVKRKSKREPSGEFRNLVIKNADDPERRRYLYEEAVWRNSRRLEKSGYSQHDVQWPAYSLGPDEKVRSRRQFYQATFTATAEVGRRYTAKLRFARWQTLRQGQHYRLGRSAFGRVRTIRPALPASDQARAGSAGSAGSAGKAGQGS